MSNRMKNPAEVIPQAYKGIGNLLAAVADGGLPETTTELIAMRVSSLNGCAACLQGHAVRVDEVGLPIEKIVGLAAYRESPFFSEAEKAALALADAVTRLADAEDAVPDELWREVTKHYDERQTAALVLCIATHNLFNRVNVTVREDAEHPFWMR
ncbi:carboxymuconolactone decarboxylase family protein [Nocardioides luteus]|uniref:carboxymuconolactone decarboxylase family protein n=1 Tax=Nocardioides luteus TaxID=1844 RepID=UPI001A34B34A|nr:carboxymuconolactone decarboxylase family protein [Nocardioides luteus]MBG6094305.1 AhpD family alkylhydroperoxidase [Nocardioides luteus]